MGPTTFPKFALLPYELRSKIWTYSLVPQTFLIEYSNWANVYVKRLLPAPTILHVNYESRTLARRAYILMAAPRKSVHSDWATRVAFIYFSPALDIFSFDCSSFQYYFKSIMIDEWFEALKRKPGFRVQLTSSPQGTRDEVEGYKVAQNPNAWETRGSFEVARTKVEGLKVVEDEGRERRRAGLYSRAYHDIGDLRASWYPRNS